MKKQRILQADEHYTQVDAYLRDQGVSCLLLVCNPWISRLRIGKYLDSLTQRLGIRVVPFSDFCPNPQVESVSKGIELLQAEHCDGIAVIGGGSAIDVAKCIRLYGRQNPADLDLLQPAPIEELPFLAVPTTAGTGSEATRYAVVYAAGEKQSITSEQCIPDAVLLDASVLKTLPEYQRHATMMDAFCHAVEAFWSLNATQESEAYARQALTRILESMDSYLRNEDQGNTQMLHAANLAGKAINITQTTAGHAMCYKLTSLYGIAHGHAAALCVRQLWPFMLANPERCIDPRGEAYLHDVFVRLAETMTCHTPEQAAERFGQIVDRLALPVPKAAEADLPLLVHGVNPVRLKNFPMRMDQDTIALLYRKILRL